MFFISFAKLLVEYGWLTYGAASKPNLEPIDTAQRKILRVFYYKKQSDSLPNNSPIKMFRAFTEFMSKDF